MPEKTIETRRYKIVQSYFRNILALQRKQQLLVAQIESFQSMLFMSGVEGGEVVRKTTEMDPLGEGFSKLAEKVDELDTELIGYVEEIEQAREVLAGIADSPAYEVFRYRYFEGYRYRDIARLVAYSEDYVKELHRKGLYRLYDFLPREYRQK